MDTPIQPELAVFKYQHKDAPRISDKRRWSFRITLVLALLVSMIAFPGGLATLLVPLLVRITAQKNLCLGPRYLLCGNTIIYYANIKSLKLDTVMGIMKLQTENGASFTLEREKFPTGARKVEKIAKNKTEKFNKVAYKIVEKAQRAAPAAEFILP